jgi:signal transduction histidine kinase
VSNLLVNAIKFSPGVGDIAVVIERRVDDASGSWAVLPVRDRGLGIPASDLPHIFEGFRRASNVEHIRGTGVGLASARQSWSFTA